MPSATRSRRDKNNLYMLDELFGNVHRSAAGTIWRWRTEVATFTGTGLGIYVLNESITTVWAIVIITVTGIALGVIPQTRRYFTGRFWCLITRHRIQRACWETRLHTRSGRLPLILRIKTTEVGERAWIWCRAGISAEDFTDHADEISAACYARETRISKNKQHSQLLTIDVIRRDTLHANKTVAPHVITGPISGVTTRIRRTRFRVRGLISLPTRGR